MKELNKEFAEEIKSLLSNYFEANERDSFFGKFEGNDSPKSSSNQLINNFYAQQLKIEYSFAKERMEIDRAITFAMKNIKSDMYLELLRKLGQICISHGN